MTSPHTFGHLLGIIAVFLSALTPTHAEVAVSEPVRYTTLTNLSYYSEDELATADKYQTEQCKLDLYLPENRTGFPTIVWFHGGGLTGGKRGVPALLKERGFAVAAVSYRLSPKGKLPDFFQDAAASTAWVIKTIEQKGGDPKKVFVGGHSAGGYLALIIGMDPRWLAAKGLTPQELAGIISVSGQVTTHFHVRKLRGDESPALRPVIDEYAPLHHARADLPPICLIVGDHRIEYLSRVEENALFAVTLKNLGHRHVYYHEMGGLNHGTVGEGGLVVLREFVNARVSPPKASTTAP
ncbi:MAG TPA: alpha/beta hydrolase [Opitutaceae bacterium]|nr:alpha/beta hydrolase [Opitutaceae bacterium]